MRVVLATIVMLLGVCGWAAGQEPVQHEAAGLNVEMFPLEDLRPGLKGTGYTVVRGTKVETFAVEVLELIPKGGFDGGPMILARFTGNAVDLSDGIAAGYSGSPVYIDGKLLGAISMAMPYTDTHVGGITPIQSMLTALPDHEEPDYSENTVLPETESNGVPLDEEGNIITFVNSMETARDLNERFRALGIRHFAAVPARTPICFSGLSPAVLQTFGPKLKEALGEGFQLLELPMGTAADHGLFLDQNEDAPGLLLDETTEQPPLAPGDAIAVSLIQGDLEAYAVGTLTYSDDKGRFLCFGHPLLGSGKANFPIGKGYVTWTFGSSVRAFKTGVRLNTTGTLTKDHAAACGGSFDEEPDLIPVRIKIKDIDLGTSETMRIKVIRHPDFTPLLIAIGMSNLAMQVLDRDPSGTLKLSYHIEGAGLKEPLRRTNYYSDDLNVIMNGAYDLMPIHTLLETNIYREVNVTKVELMLEITRNRINASIDDAEIILEEPDATAQETADEEGDGPGDEDEAEEKDSDSEGPDVELPEIDLGTAEERNKTQQEPPTPTEGEEEFDPSMQMGMDSAYMEELPTYAPGDTIRVKVRLQPFRTDPVWREFKIDVPSDFPPGNTTLIVHGGGDLISFSELGGKGRSLFGFGPVIDVNERDLDSILEQIVEWPLNNELLLTLQRPYDPTAALELGEQESGETIEEKADAVYQMEWVIYNGFMIPVNIVTETNGDLQDEQEYANEEDTLEENGEAKTMPYEDEPEHGDDTQLPF